MKHKPLTNEEVAYFCEQLGMMIEAGIPLADGLEALAQEADDQRLKEVAEQLCTAMNEDITLAAAMERLGIFPDYAVKTVKIGLVTGRLENTLKGLSEYYEKRADIRSTVTSAFSHPLLLLAMMTVVVIVMVVKIIPMFRDIFFRFDESAAAAAESSVDFAYKLGIVLMTVLLAVLVIAAVTALLSAFPKTRKALYGAGTNFIFTRKISESVAMADVTSALCMMAECGISPEESLELAKGLTGNRRISARLDECEKLVLEGEGFADAVKKSGLLNPMDSHSLRSAYKAGTFETAWRKISERCRNECDRRIYGAVSLIEPIMIGIIAVMIGSLLLAVMLPMTDIISSLG